MLRTTSVNISWTIPSFPEIEEYTVQYGVESNSLNLTSSTIDSVTDTTLVNQTYSIVINDLEAGTIYYMRVLAQYGVDIVYNRYSELTVFRTLEQGKSML